MKSKATQSKEQQGPSLLGPSCRVCGCTQFAACEGGCHWVSGNLCSACALMMTEVYSDSCHDRYALQVARELRGRSTCMARVLLAAWWAEEAQASAGRELGQEEFTQVAKQYIAQLQGRGHAELLVMLGLVQERSAQLELRSQEC